MRRTRIITAVTAWGCIQGGVARAEDTRNSAAVFPLEADILAEPGLVRLPLSSEVLGHVRADLADVRIHTPGGREIPYIIDSRPGTETHTVRGFELEIVNVTASVRDPGTWPVHSEVLALRAKEPLPADGSWELSFETSTPAFVRRLDVIQTAEGDNAAAASALYSGSIYRMTGPPRERLTIPLAGPPKDTFTVTLEGDALPGRPGGYLQPNILLRWVQPNPAVPTATVNLTEVATGRREEPSTRFVLSRPAGFVPSAVELQSESEVFFRHVRIYDGTGIDRRLLGEGDVYRLADNARVERLRVPVSRSSRTTLVIELDPADDPLPTALRFVAVTSQPSLVFHHSIGATLRFGGERVRAPAYTETNWMNVGETNSAPMAQLSAVRSNPAFRSGPALAFAHRPGGAIDLQTYTHVRDLRIDLGSEGVGRYRLRPADTAIARTDLGDLRVVDAEGRQWAFLIDRNVPRELTPVADAPEATVDERHKRSTFRFEARARGMVVDAISLESMVSYFDRGYELAVERDGKTYVVARGRLAREPESYGRIDIAFPAARVDALELRVADGNDGPLEFDSARLSVVVADLYVAAPPGDYRLLLGNPLAEMPHYELNHVSELVFGVPPGRAAPGDLEINRLYEKAPNTLPMDRIAIWVVLALSVLVLTWLTLRLARAEAVPAQPEG